MAKNRKRWQNQKVGNPALAKAMQELRRSNATTRHKSPKDYRRKPKHGGWA